MAVHRNERASLARRGGRALGRSRRGVGAPGFGFDGGFGEKVALGTEALVGIPDGVSMAQGAAGTDAGMTSHHAVMVVGGVKAGDKVGIIGLGGPCQIGARVAVLAGAEVYVAEINEKVWPLAESLGATATARSIAEFADVGLGGRCRRSHARHCYVRPVGSVTEPAGGT